MYTSPNKLSTRARRGTRFAARPTWDNLGSEMRALKHAALVIRRRGSLFTSQCLDVLMFEPSIFRQEGILQ